MSARVRFVLANPRVDVLAVVRVVAWAALLIGTVASVAMWGAS